jgi:hypothetical protein
MALASLILLISPHPQKPRFLSSSKIGMEIFGFRKNLFQKLLPCVEVTHMSKFHPVWGRIAQESNLGRKGWILGENHVSRDLPADNVWSQWIMSGLTRIMFGFP